jgi:predicted dehydrogenase
VRWTEGRNFQEVLRLMASGDLHVGPLVGSVVPVAQAAQAYVTLQSSERPIAVLLEYPGGDTRPDRSVAVQLKTTAAAKSGQVVLGVIGAGTFFRSVHQPNLARHGGFFVKRMATRSGAALRDTALRHGVPDISIDPAEVLDDPEIEAVLIATRHDRHAPLVLDAIARGKHVFVEKPLALTVEDCARIVQAAGERGTLVAIGFNRRFSPLAQSLRTAVKGFRGPKSVLYRVNAGVLPRDHWLRDPQEGGGRLRGEGVHFFDFVRWLIGADVDHVTAVAARTENGSDPDEASVALGFADGSIGTVVYSGLGSSDLGKERVEVFGAGQAAVLDDFRSLHFHGVTGRSSEGGRTVEKGHLEILTNFHDALRGKAALGVTAEDGYWATWCAERALRAITGDPRPRETQTEDA